MRCTATLALCLIVSTVALADAPADIFDQVQHGYADNNGVKIHYASLGEGPPVVMVHGFPDFWYSWRHQMAALSDSFKCVAMDLRGYNLSDKPKGDENYTLPHLIGDVAAVIKANGADKAIVVGHDWGGAIAWQFAFAHPEMVKRLVICNLPHQRLHARVGHQPGTTEEQRVRAQLPAARRGERPQRGRARGVCRQGRSPSHGALRRSVQKSDFTAMLA